MLAGGAKKAERRLVKGAARHSCRQSEAVPERSRGRKGGPDSIERARHGNQSQKAPAGNRVRQIHLVRTPGFRADRAPIRTARCGPGPLRTSVRGELGETKTFGEIPLDA